MKFSSQEEYGLRCLIRIGKSSSPNGLTIPEISQLEGLSEAHVGKILRILRLGSFVESSRGQTGGYKLSRPANKIIIGEVLSVLGGKLFESGFCENHSGVETICTHTIDCSVRSLWSIIQNLLDGVLSKTTLQNLLGSEEETKTIAINISDEVEIPKISSN
ncbi:MAG: Rrf2 family transcriptional regulator [Ignavibacteriaceae bacterium]